MKVEGSAFLRWPSGYQGSFSALLYVGALSFVLFVAQDLYSAGGLLGSQSKLIHPALLVIFIAAFLSALWQFTEVKNPRAKSALKSAHAWFTGLVLSATAIRGLQWVFQIDLPVIDDLLGTTNSQPFVSFWTLALLSLLCTVGIGPYWPRESERLWADYGIVFLICTVSLWQFGRQAQGSTDTVLPGVSMVSNALLLMLALYKLSSYRLWSLLFDTRSPNTNLVIALGLSTIFVTLAFLSASLYSLWVVAAATAAWYGLTVWANRYRSGEIEQRIRAGLLEASTPDAGTRLPRAALKSVYATPLNDPMLRSIRYWHFEAPEWQRYAMVASLTFGLSLAAIFISRTTQSHVATIWWANAYLAYCLVQRRPPKWLPTIVVFSVALYLANMVAGVGWLPSVLLGVVNATEGFFLALVLAATLNLRVRSGRVLIENESLRRLLPTGLAGAACILLMAPLGGGTVALLFGGDLVVHIRSWGLASLMGSVMVLALALSIFAQVHTGYPSPRPRSPKDSWISVFLLVAPLLIMYYSIGPVYQFPAIALAAFSLPLFFLPSLWDAMRIFVVIVPVLWVLGNQRWQGDYSFQVATAIILLSTFFVAVFVTRTRLALEKHQHDLALGLTPTGLVTLDSYGRIATASASVPGWLEIDPDAVKGRALASFFDEHAELGPQVASAFGSDPTAKFQVPVHRTTSAGKRLTFRATVLGVNDPAIQARYVVALEDVSPEQLAQQQRNELIEKSRSIVLIYSSDMAISLCSQGWMTATGYTKEETLGRNLNDFATSKVSQGQTPPGASSPDANLGYMHREYSAEILCKSGAKRSFIVSQAAQERASADFFLVVDLVDITDLKARQAELENSLSAVQVYLQAGLAAVALIDETPKMVFSSEAYNVLCGVPDTDSMMAPEDFYLPESYREYLAIRELTRDMPLNVPYVHPVLLKARRPDGTVFTVRRSQRWFKSPLGESRLMMVLLEDMTNLVETQEQLESLVNRDDLTGLLSRRGMKSLVARIRLDSDLALFVIDLDYFKSVNDNFGHDAGDALLIAVGKTLEQAVQGRGSAVRLGGEEFALVLPWTSPQDLNQFAQQLRTAIEQTTIVVHDRTIHRSASIGVARLNTADDLSTGLHLADLAQREAKQTGRNRVVWADEELIAALTDRGLFISAEEVQQALLNEEIYYAVQPIWNCVHAQIEGFEALIRWKKSDGTAISPMQFLPALQTVFRDPSYRILKDRLMRTVLEQLSDFPDAYVSFNITLEELAYQDAALDMHAQIQNALDYPERKIVLEISESAIHSRTDEDIVRLEMTKLHAFGYAIALDDFGVESSNLKRLQDFPIDILKLDKVLISDIATDLRQRKTVFSLSQMVSALGSKVIVEGVETKQQYQVLRVMGLHVHQGYFHAYPMRPEEIRSKLSQIGQSDPTMGKPTKASTHKDGDVDQSAN